MNSVRQVRAVVQYVEDPRAFWLGGRPHMLFTRKNLNFYKKVCRRDRLACASQQ